MSEEELAGFLAPERVLEQFPNRLVPKLVRSNVEDMLRESIEGKKSISRQTYAVHNAVAEGNWVALQVKWEGMLAMPVAGLPSRATMRAWFAMFLKFRDGKIVHQSNYDCFEPW